MAKGPRYKVPLRRRRECKTDYRQRLRLLLSGKPRFVVRPTLRHIICQIVDVDEKGDKTLVYAHSKTLREFGWKAYTSNIPSAYLVGYLCGKRALKKGIEEAVLDMGLKSKVKGCKIFAAVKGALDAGLKIPCSEEVLPTEDRIRGEHIVEFYQNLPEKLKGKMFTQSDPTNLPQLVNEIKGKIDEVESSE